MNEQPDMNSHKYSAPICLDHFLRQYLKSQTLSVLKRKTGLQ